MVTTSPHESSGRCVRVLESPPRLYRWLVSVNEEKAIAAWLYEHAALWTAKAILTWKYAIMLEIPTNRFSEWRFNVWSLCLKLLTTFR